MANPLRPFIPPERTSTRRKQRPDYFASNSHSNSSSVPSTSDPHVKMEPDSGSKKRKSTSSSQDTEPQPATKRIKTASGKETPQRPTRVVRKTSATDKALTEKNGRSKRKPKSGTGARASQMVADMTGEEPSGLAAQNLLRDPDGHRAKMVTSDPTNGSKKSTRGSISQQPRRRAGLKSRSVTALSLDTEDQPLSITPFDANDRAGHAYSSEIAGDSENTSNTMGTIHAKEEQLPTPESTQDIQELEDDGPDIVSLPSETLQTRGSPSNRGSNDYDRISASPNVTADLGLKTPEHANEANDVRRTQSSDALSDLSDSTFDKYEIGLDVAAPTSSTAAVVDGPIARESEIGPLVEPGANIAQRQRKDPQKSNDLTGSLENPMSLSVSEVLNETAMEENDRSQDSFETIRPRSRRSIKPVSRYGELVGTAAAVTAATENFADESSYLQGNAEVDNDDHDMDETDEIIDLEDGSTYFGQTKSREESKKTKASVKTRDTPASVRSLQKFVFTPRTPDGTGLVKLKVSPESPLVAFNAASAPRKTSGPSLKSSGVKRVVKTKVIKQKGPIKSFAPRPGPLHLATETDESGFDPALLALSKKLSHREPLGLKPKTAGKPEVWADSRQALCETVPYFRMPQSGCHQNDRHVYAFLFDATGHCREYMDSDVVIARAGGSMEGDGTGQLLQKKDHLMTESQVQSVLNDIEHQNPVVIIAGNRHEGAICKFPHRYNVLGWFKPVAVWAEKTMGKGAKVWTTIKYRFERLDPTTTPWYAPAQTVLTEEEYNSVGAPIFQTCSQCNNRYPVTYLNGWMCLNADCEQFWKLQNGRDAPYGKLPYHPAFLLTRARWTNEQEPFSVRPPIPNIGAIVGDNLTYINTRGICCPQCGRCSSRRLFKGWKCDNPTCTYQNFPKHIPVKPEMLHNPWDSVGDNIGDGPALAKNKHEKEHGVKVTVSHRLGFKIYTYTFEGVNGKFVHAVSNSAINRQPRGPDEMFAAMQQQEDPGMDLHLERRRFNGKWVAAADNSYAALFRAIQEGDQRKASDIETIRRESFLTQLVGNSATVAEADVSSDFTRQLQEAAEAQPETEGSSDIAQTVDDVPEAVEDGDFMTAFSINYGMPYKFVATGASLPFTNAPWPVRACQADLNWASKNFLTAQGHQEFNELLIFAYLQGQKIEYHDDGESGLGPRISTLSLGGKAKMHLRMKQKHYVGCSKSGILNTERPVPGSIEGQAMYQERLAAWQELQTFDLSTKHGKATYERRRKEIPKELGLYEKRTKKAGDLVTITLNHGDIVLMEGYEIQQYLEHKVVPEGCLRFAMTCRTVLPEHLKPEERPKYGVEPHDPSISSLYRMDKEERQRQGGQR
ncbi:hypothetical protein HII31_00768 [Pseudocercospora fuligena]|uniref:Alpha-ketoglutarate-dependent dioxygenase AlkB-like domain-containing protein n=1 Tax=Pseudocercospora fuligena TaxID=685502 RepID=A0A8H6RT32_9PEZI|nr:hypothetical protein HII31_00768 [Pseudocercospora fuligena]